MEKSYNILVIGNGFDLAHGLPTTYNDFFEFAEVSDGTLWEEQTAF